MEEILNSLIYFKFQSHKCLKLTHALSLQYFFNYKSTTTLYGRQMACMHDGQSGSDVVRKLIAFNTSLILYRSPQES
jgi:hypothetical protein